MKNIFFLLSILLSQAVYCQDQRLGDFLTSLFAPLDKTEISSDFLWDKGTNGLAEPAVFDGILRDSVYLQPQTFGFLYMQAAMFVTPFRFDGLLLNDSNKMDTSLIGKFYGQVRRFFCVKPGSISQNLLNSPLLTPTFFLDFGHSSPNFHPIVSKRDTDTPCVPC